ncbi:hypothetical protein [Marivita sp. S0852]|uniref:hypothetical protein n=1 Tax=Marivita sp. S0852 TaxID=3373893 RepID=UPI003982CA64
MVAVGELDYDDPFTAILSYDGTQTQPWQRVDVQRDIYDLGFLAAKAETVVTDVALSDEGDVYLIHDGQFERSKIPGASALSDDATGLGAVYSLVVRDQQQVVTGRSRQMYVRNGRGDWSTLSAGEIKLEGYGSEDFGDKAAFLSDGSLLLSSSQRPSGPKGTLMQDPRIRADMTAEELGELMALRRAESSDKDPITRLYHYIDGAFKALDVPPDIHIRDIYVAPDDKVWITGVDGLVLTGTPQDGFRRLDFHGDTETIHSITQFKGDMIAVWGTGLYQFDGHRMILLKPKLNDPFRNRDTPAPMKVQAVGDIMFYFDHKHGVCRWDGQTWDWIYVPPELLEQDFSGLLR